MKKLDLKIGQFVILKKIPEYIWRGLPEIDIKEIKDMINKKLLIEEINKEGYFELSYTKNSTNIESRSIYLTQSEIELYASEI